MFNIFKEFIIFLLTKKKILPYSVDNYYVSFWIDRGY